MGNIAMDMFPKAHKQPPVDVQPSFMDKHKQTFADNLYQMYDVTKLWCDLTLVAGIDKTAYVFTLKLFVITFVREENV